MTNKKDRKEGKWGRMRTGNREKLGRLTAAGSMVAFHVDMTGSSVFYAVLSGKNIFYVLPNTPENFKLFRQLVSTSTRK